ncbi:MAG: Holliday junction resolvase RuvX, partial [Chlamydiia bacterium]|nr:Holliday junction resolvase RuvX [Chlamydiia bacterium]
PRKMNGSTGVMADEVLQAATLLTQALQLPVVLWDERLTSVEAERSMREIGGMRRKKRTEHVDTLAAVILLQSYLEGKRLQE